MKKIRVIFCLCFLVFSVKSQDKKVFIGDNNISSRTYKVSSSNAKKINVKDKYSKVEAYVKSKRLSTETTNSIEFTDKNAVSKIVNNTLSKERRNGRILISLYVNGLGGVEEVEFIISEANLLSLNEIDQLSQNLKKGLKFKTVGQFRSSNKIICIVQTLSL